MDFSLAEVEERRLSESTFVTVSALWDIGFLQVDVFELTTNGSIFASRMTVSGLDFS